MRLPVFAPLRPIAALVIALAAASCTPEAIVAPAVPVEQTTFASALGVNLANMTKTSSGLYYQDTPAGTGATAASGNHVTVHYTGYLPNGTTIDTSIGKTAFGFNLGTGSVIKGWDEGMVGMRVGGTRKLVIPAELGYGGAAVGPIPANSVLVFQIQLISIP
jgi:FKBP-type peptidyl-prolyl cis-trans isomerase FkpA